MPRAEAWCGDGPAPGLAHRPYMGRVSVVGQEWRVMTRPIRTVTFSAGRWMDARAAYAPTFAGWVLFLVFRQRVEEWYTR